MAAEYGLFKTNHAIAVSSVADPREGDSKPVKLTLENSFFFCFFLNHVQWSHWTGTFISPDSLKKGIFNFCASFFLHCADRKLFFEFLLKQWGLKQIPSWQEDSFSLVFAIVVPTEFGSCFSSWFLQFFLFVQTYFCIVQTESFLHTVKWVAKKHAHLNCSEKLPKVGFVWD